LICNSIFFVLIGTAKGFAHILFENKEQAAGAANSLNNVNYGGRTLRSTLAGVKPEITRNPENSSNGGDGRRTFNNNSAPRGYRLFLGNLSWDMTESILEEMLTDVVGEGSYSSVEIVIDDQTNRSRGIGYANFINKDFYEKALRELNGLEVFGRVLRVEQSFPRRKPFTPNGNNNQEE
jgi:RNA recognition motif-containing protein